MKMEIRRIGCLQDRSSSQLDLAEPLPPGLFNSPRHAPENPDNTRVVVAVEGPDKDKDKVERADAELGVETRDTETQTEDEERFLHKAR